jgi:hypothetical protein
MYTRSIVFPKVSPSSASDIEGVESISPTSPIAPVKVHAPINGGVEARFWQDRQFRGRQQRQSTSAGATEHEQPMPPGQEATPPEAVAETAISQLDTLELHISEPEEKNPFVSLIEHQLHLHLPTDTDAADTTGKLPG